MDEVKRVNRGISNEVTNIRTKIEEANPGPIKIELINLETDLDNSRIDSNNLMSEIIALTNKVEIIRRQFISAENCEESEEGEEGEEDCEPCSECIDCALKISDLQNDLNSIAEHSQALNEDIGEIIEKLNEEFKIINSLLSMYRKLFIMMNGLMDSQDEEIRKTGEIFAITLEIIVKCKMEGFYANMTMEEILTFINKIDNFENTTNGLKPILEDSVSEMDLGSLQEIKNIINNDIKNNLAQEIKDLIAEEKIILDDLASKVYETMKIKDLPDDAETLTWIESNKINAVLLDIKNKINNDQITEANALIDNALNDTVSIGGNGSNGIIPISLIKEMTENIINKKIDNNEDTISIMVIDDDHNIDEASDYLMNEDMNDVKNKISDALDRYDELINKVETLNSIEKNKLYNIKSISKNIKNIDSDIEDMKNTISNKMPKTKKTKPFTGCEE
jgi:hypothetical protein